MQPALGRSGGSTVPRPWSSRVSAAVGTAAPSLLRLNVPDYVKATHELLVSAWRFAETAVNARYDAVSTGNVRGVAGVFIGRRRHLMVTRVQQDIRALLEPPRLP